MPIQLNLTFEKIYPILTPDDRHEIHFGLTKGCNADDTVFWVVDFLLKEAKNGQMKTRIEVHVHVGKDKTADAANLAIFGSDLTGM